MEKTQYTHKLSVFSKPFQLSVSNYRCKLSKTVEKSFGPHSPYTAGVREKAQEGCRGYFPPACTFARRRHLEVHRGGKGEGDRERSGEGVHRRHPPGAEARRVGVRARIVGGLRGARHRTSQPETGPELARPDWRTVGPHTSRTGEQVQTPAVSSSPFSAIFALRGGGWVLYKTKAASQVQNTWGIHQQEITLKRG